MKPLFLTLTFSSGVIIPLFAEEPLIFGPRSLALGGTGVANSDDLSASHYNPAIFAYFDPGPGDTDPTAGDYDNNDLSRRGLIGVDLFSIQAGLRQFGEMGDLLQTLADERDSLRSINDNGLQTSADVGTLVRIGAALARVDDPGNAIGVDATAMAGVRFGSVGIGVRAWGQAVGFVEDLDLLNLAIASAGGGDLSADINASGAPQAASITVLVGLDLDGNTAVDSPAELALEYQAQQLGLNPNQAQDLVDVLNGVNAQYDGVSDFSANQTRVVLTGLTVMEIPVTYGHDFSDQFSVGVTLRGMVGRVHGSTILVFDEDNDDLSKVLDEYEESVNVGVDLGAFYRLPKINLGIAIHNLNAPSFDAPPGFEKATLDPQVTVGASFFPWKTLGLSLDLDVLEADSVFRDHETQRVMIGLEWDVARILALRVGGYSNLAEDDVGEVVTAGLGLNLWLVRIDLAGAMSLDNVEVDGTQVPREARVGLRLASEW